MKMACRPLRALAFSLLLPLTYGIAGPQQLQVSVSSQLFKANSVMREIPVDTRPLNPFDQVADKPESADKRLTDSTVFNTNAPVSPVIYYFYEPFPMEPGSSFWQIGASVSLVPLAEAEQEYPMPGLDIEYKRGLFKNVSFAGSISTSYYSNLFHTGIQYSANLDRFSYGIANHVGFAYGFMKNVSLFDDVEAYGLFYMPILRFGYRFDDFSLSCSLVMTYVFKSDSHVHDSRAYVGPEKTINDYYCTWVVEQPFLSNLHLSVGFSLGYARTPYQSWMQYNTTDEWLFVPEFFFAVQL
jgi:hypothetical protein